ncbi:MAG: transposase family protein [Fibrobacter sp.]|nr:transposase family protein [Fibrobacter sp.]
MYLSPAIDCFDGMPVVWTIGRTPTAELTNKMLDSVISQLKPWERPIIYSDRGGHYR